MSGATVDLLVTDIEWEQGVDIVTEFQLTMIPWHLEYYEMYEEIRAWLMLEFGTFPDTFTWTIL